MTRLPGRLGPRRAPLVSAIAAGLAIAAPAFAWMAPLASQSQRSGVVELHDMLRALMPAASSAPTAAAQTRTVGSCADDGGAQTLRAAIAAAADGDIIDTSQLACSRITLTQGAVRVLLDNLTIVGPGRGNLRIDGAGVDRVFLHPGLGALTLRDVSVGNGASRVSGNHVTGGGCIASAGYVVLDHAEVSDCEAVGEGVYGGAIYAYGLRMYTSTLARNTGRGSSPDTGTAAFGGGAYATTVTLIESTVSGNLATRDAGQRPGYETGGGIFVNLGGYVGASTIEGNYSHGLGGGLAAFGGALTVINSTVSGNTAKTASGGGIDLRVFAGGTIANSTITANHAAVGGGVYLRGQPRTFTLQSALIAGNGADGAAADFGAVAALTVDGANNLVAAADANVALPADTLHANPQLLPLANNGGPTRTHALSAGSPALDAGNNNAGLATDQRGAGFPRQVGSAPDIGAFEGFLAPAPGPVNVPGASRSVLGLLAFLLGALGAVATTLSRRG